MVRLLKFENSAKNIISKHSDKLFIILVLGIAAVIRFCMLAYVSRDYEIFLKPWFDFIKSNGGINALRYDFTDFSNYSMPYMLIMVILTYIPMYSMYAIKIVSMLFDFAAAFTVYKIVSVKFKKPLFPLIAMCAVLFAPTVILNGAFWAQCDIIYTTWLLAAIYCFMKNKNMSALIFFSLAFSFKMQAIFLLPLLVILYFKRNFSILNFLLIPIIYTLFSLPGVIAGQDFMKLLLVYKSQVGTYKMLTLNSPNFYAWIPNVFFKTFNYGGIAFAAAIILVFCFIIYKSKVVLDNSLIMEISLLSALLIPYLLPQMHERYFFAADILSIVYLFYSRERYYIPIVISLVSFFSYTPYLFKSIVIDIEYLAIILLAVIIMLSADLLKRLFPEGIEHS